jgi:hypothetical protein
MELPLTLVVEGTTDAPVLRRLLVEAGLLAGPEYIKDGKAALDQSLAGYNNVRPAQRPIRGGHSASTSGKILWKSPLSTGRGPGRGLAGGRWGRRGCGHGHRGWR